MLLSQKFYNRNKTENPSKDALHKTDDSTYSDEETKHANFAFQNSLLNQGDQTDQGDQTLQADRAFLVD